MDLPWIPPKASAWGIREGDKGARRIFFISTCLVLNFYKLSCGSFIKIGNMYMQVLSSIIKSRLCICKYVYYLGAGSL